MEAILELADKLGKLIAKNPKAEQMKAARDALDASPDDRQLLIDFEGQQNRLHQLQANGQPIEPDDKRALVELQDKVIASPVIKELMKAQTDYVELMTTVTARIEGAIMG